MQEKLGKKSESQMGFKPTTIRDLVGLVGCSSHRAIVDSTMSKGQLLGLNWNHIARLHSQVMTGTN